MVDNMTYWEVYQKGKQELSKAQADSACAFECWCLMESVFGYPKTQVLLHQKDPAPKEGIDRFFNMIRHRLEGYPLQYLLGSWEFWGYPFAVGEGVLIPRADTETLAELCIREAAQFDHPVLADLCSGSGCLPVVFSKEIAAAQTIYAVELSPDALPYLKQNVEQNDCRNITVLQEDVLTWVPPQPLHLISSNPPYLSAQEMQELQTEVTYEPQMALEAAEEGLFFYRMISERYFNYLLPGGVLAFEVGYRQAAAVASLMQQNDFEKIRTVPDLCGVQRVVIGQRPLS